MKNHDVSAGAKDAAASWKVKLAMTAAVLGASVGASVGTAEADIIIEDPKWNGMPESAKLRVLSSLEAVQHKVELAPEAVQIKIDDAIEAVQIKFDLR